jgi:GAF domain-containing protein
VASMSAPPAEEPGLRALSELTGALLSEQRVPDLLDVIVNLATSALSGVAGASVSLLAGGGPRFETINASSSTVRRIDEAQYERAEGPCVEAVRTGEEVSVLLPADKWQQFSSQAEEAGMRSVWSLPLAAGGRTIGALNLYSLEEQPWSYDGRRVARGLAAQAAVVLANAASLASSEMVNRHLQQALVNRDLIGQAKGILMVRQRVTADDAFDILRSASQHSGRKLSDIAAEVVGQLEVPPQPQG